MNKTNDFNEKLKKIKDDHRKLLEIVRESIKEDGIVLGNQIHAVYNCINYDENQIMKYRAICDAKCTIEKLINMILLATTHVEVVSIREHLNYYIDKIKREMVNRKLSDAMITSYQTQASYLRTDIAKSIRVLKRETNIITIEDLILLSEVVVPSDEETIKSMIKNEMSFNDYYLKPQKISTPKEKVNTNPTIIETHAVINGLDYLQEINPEDTELENLSHAFKSLLIEPNIKEHEKDDDIPQEINPEDTELENLSHAFKSLLLEPNIKEHEKADDIPQQMNPEDSELENLSYAFKSLLEPKTDDIPKNSPLNYSKYANEREFLSAMAKRYTKYYHIDDLKKYDGSTGKNLLRFFANLPTYIYNKLAVNEMDYDSSLFNNESDFISFIEYTRRRNSIRNALKSVFSKSYLVSFEGQCLNNHERCVKWMQTYCEENGLEVKINHPRLSNL